MDFRYTGDNIRKFKNDITKYEFGSYNPHSYN